MTKPVQARDASKPFLTAQDDAGRLETDPEHPADCEQVGYVLKRDPRGSIGLPGPLPPLPGGLGRFASRYVSQCYTSQYSRITDLSLGQIWRSILSNLYSSANPRTYLA